MTEEQEKQPVYIVNDERVDAEGNPVKGSRSASEPEAEAEADDTKQTAKRKSQSEKPE